MKKLIFLLIPLAVIGFTTIRADANSITFNFDSIISGTGIAPVTSLGTLTLTDNGNFVDLLMVSRNDPAFKVLELDLNFNDSIFSNSSALSLQKKSLAIDLNAIKAGGYPGRFDISIPGKGNIGAFGTYTDTLMLNNGASKLSTADLIFKDTTDQLFASIHIGNFNSGASVWAGATAVAVPEPTTLVLLGLGLLSVKFLRKRLGYSPNAPVHEL